MSCKYQNYWIILMLCCYAGMEGSFRPRNEKMQATVSLLTIHKMAF